MRIKIVPILLTMSALIIVALAGCSSPDAASEPVASESLSLEEIINRSRLAMADVITYKTRREEFDSEFYGDLTLSSGGFSEFHSYDRFVYGAIDTDNGGIKLTEWLQVGNRVFLRPSETVWQEREPFSGPMDPTTWSSSQLSHLFRHDFELISTDEVTSGGVAVYRIAYTEDRVKRWAQSPGYAENFEVVWGARPVSVLYTTALLIDKESFRVVSRVADLDYRSEPSELREVTSWQKHIKIDYYDINEPVVIEVPDQYVPWEELVTLN